MTRERVMLHFHASAPQEATSESIEQTTQAAQREER